MSYTVETVNAGHRYSRHMYNQYMVVDSNGYAAGNPFAKVKLYSSFERAQQSADRLNKKFDKRKVSE